MMKALDAQTTTRNYGIDLLRIFSMFLVVVLHVNGQTGLFENVPEGTLGKYFLVFLDALAICAVNVFAVITGYVSLSRKFSLNKTLKIWLQVAFYSVITYTIYALITNTFSVVNFLKCFIPVISGKWWYFTAYFLLLLVMPLLNLIIKNLTKSGHLIIVLAIFLLSVVWLYNESIWEIKGGYSAFWLICLYFVGAYFKKWGLLRYKKVTLTLIYLIATLLIAGVRTFIPLVFNTTKFASRLFIYCTPLVLVQAIALLNLFAKITIKNNAFRNIVKFASPLAFGVYLIHLNVLFNTYIMSHLVAIINFSEWLYIPLVIASAMAIYIVCSLIEYLRQMLFKYCRINKLADIVGNGVQRKFVGFIENKCNVCQETDSVKKDTDNKEE